MATTVDVTTLLLQDINKQIEIVLENEKCDEIWGKSLKEMPIFTIKEIDKHRLNSGKRAAIIKTMDRGRKFMEERYINRDSIFTQSTNTHFSVKGECKASMKREIRKMKVILNKKTGKVESGTCDCPAGKSGYCNHIMAILFEIADYSLHQLKEVPQEVACTSTSRQWGVPSDVYKYPKPVMDISVHKKSVTRGVTCTLYNPRINSDENFIERVAKTHINMVQ